jgi:hypothetical protein
MTQHTQAGVGMKNHGGNAPSQKPRDAEPDDTGAGASESDEEE